MPEKLTLQLDLDQRQELNRLALLSNLTPYSPELNLVEAEGRKIKYQGLPRRSFEKLDELLQVVETALQQRTS